MGILLKTGGTLDGFALQIGDGAIQCRLQIGLHLCQRIGGAFLFGTGKFFIKLFQ